VPGVAVGYLLVALAYLAFIAAGRLRHRRYGLVAILAAVAVWLMASIYLFFSVPAGSLATVPMGQGIGWIVGGGVLATMLGAGLLALFAVMTALAWLADRIPILRRLEVGESIRRHAGSRF
jgi:hypothetical protein